MFKKKKLYMIGNAHLDPVWMWTWQEGSAQVKSTIQSALDRMNETPDFKFVSSQAIMYDWLSEISPEMLEEVKKRVEEGRFIICGGWWIQPDCNIPSGESFARHSLYGQRKFKELLGTTATVGYNVDSFGHNAMLPQILKKSGMDAYIMMRPGEHEMHFENGLFIWRSPDGTEIPTFRIQDGYGGNFGSREDFENHIEKILNAYDDRWDEALCFYGVGNHGGGPTKLNIQFIKEMQEKHPECEIVFGDPKDFFEKIINQNPALPVIDEELQHHASGCYSTTWAVKKHNRMAENRLYFAESFSTIANKLLGTPYKKADFARAWQNVLFNQFHDTMGGCSREEVYEDENEFAGESLSIASKTENTALQAISWKIDTSKLDGTPVTVFNPHPFEIKALVQINAQIKGIKTASGEQIPTQNVLSKVKPCHWREDTIFEATLPPMGYSTFIYTDEKNWHNENLKASEKELENDLIKITFDSFRGNIMSIYDKEKNIELLAANGAVPIVIDEHEHDTWSHALNYFDKEMAVFADAEIKVIETGPVRATVKVTNRYNASKLTQYFSLTTGSKKISVKCDLEWQEKHKMLKLSYPLKVTDPKVKYEIPFSYIERPCDGEEEMGHRFLTLAGNEYTMALINDCKYSFSVKGNDMRMTVVRSPLFADHGGPRHDELKYSDIGVQSFEYCLIPYGTDADYGEITREAAVFNCRPVNIIENNHLGTLPIEDSFVSVSEGIALSALKQAEDGNGYIVRAYECTGKAREGIISLSVIDAEIKANFGKFEVKTFRVNKNKIEEVLLTEYEF